MIFPVLRLICLINIRQGVFFIHNTCVLYDSWFVNAAVVSFTEW